MRKTWEPGPQGNSYDAPLLKADQGNPWEIDLSRMGELVFSKWQYDGTEERTIMSGGERGILQNAEMCLHASFMVKSQNLSYAHRAARLGKCLH